MRDSLTRPKRGHEKITKPNETERSRGEDAGVGGGGYSWEFLVGACRQVLQNPDPISDQEMSFFTPVFRPGL